MHTGVAYMIKSPRWIAGQVFLAQIDYLSNVEHIFEKLACSFLDIPPTSHLLCTLFHNHFFKILEDYEKCINIVEIHMLEYNPASFKKYLID